MARTAVTASTLPRPPLLASVAVLAQHIPLPIVQAVLAEQGKQGQRDRLLPAPFLVYLVIALSLYMPYPLREVLRCVLDGLRTLRHRALPPLAIATKGAISRARTRLGWEVLAALCARVLQPLARPATPGAWYGGRRLVALDGTTLALPDTPANAATFGRHPGQRTEGTWPRAHLVTLVEVGTRAILRATFDTATSAELVLAERLLTALTPDMLLLEDRGFIGYAWWQAVHATGAALLSRLRSNYTLPRGQRLPDGSYLTVVRPAIGQAGPPLPVRVIEYTLRGIPGAAPRYRLLTTLLDPVTAPARDLAALYHERWEAETTFDECKTHLRGGAAVVLRSKTPDLVRQEIYGLLLAHYVVRAALHDAALCGGEDPDAFSFTHAVRVLRRRLPQAATLSPPATPGVV